MSHINTCKLPSDSLLIRYRISRAYTDCYITELTGELSLAAYIEAFYTTWLFKTERFLLSWIVRKPSTDRGARQLAEGSLHTFAAWEVEERAENQLLLTDFLGHTRSWLMCVQDTDSGSTRLYFGSAVVPRIDPKTGEARLGLLFRALLGFHKLYSRALLKAAVLKIQARQDVC